MCKEGKCLECMTIDRNQLSDYLDKIARFLIGTGKIKTDDMMQEEIFDYVVEVVTSLSSDLADAKARAKTAEENWHKNEARIAKIETTAKELINVLTDGEIEIARESWGNTNTRLVSECRRALEVALKSQ